jgi:hypothetical protein
MDQLTDLINSLNEYVKELTKEHKRRLLALTCERHAFPHQDCQICCDYLTARDSQNLNA